jgi:hypothetical protein
MRGLWIVPYGVMVLMKLYFPTADADLVEEEEGEAGEEEEKEASDDELEPLTQFFSTQFFSHQQYI